MIRIIIITILCAGLSFGQTKWSKCKIDNTKLRECLDGEVKKKEWRKWYIAYECDNEDSKHYYWVADKMISDDAINLIDGENDIVLDVEIDEDDK